MTTINIAGVIANISANVAWLGTIGFGIGNLAAGIVGIALWADFKLRGASRTAPDRQEDAW